MTNSRPQCRFRDLWQVATELALGIALLHALFRPDPYTILWFVDTAFVVMMMEAVMLVPLSVAGGNLHGRHRLTRWLGIGAGALACVICYAFGGAWFSLAVGLQVHARIAGLADEPDLTRYETRDFFGVSELPGVVKNRWMVQFIVMIGVLVTAEMIWDVRERYAPASLALLRAAGATQQHSLGEVITMLGGIGLYFILTAVNSVVRLPCLHSRSIPEVPVQALVAGVERDHREREAKAAEVAQAAEEARAERSRAGDLIAAAMASQDGAQALLLALAGEGADPAIAGLTLSRKLIAADAALSALRTASQSAKAEALRRLEAAIRADARLTPLEFALVVLARTRLAGGTFPAEPATIAQRAAEFDTLLALVARAGEGDVAKAMASGRSAFGLTFASEPPTPDLRGALEALRRLRDLHALDRTRLVRAIAGAVVSMNEARVALLYAIAAALEVTLPREVRLG